jgi:phospholipid/cholesterol/gamma-HCH transport system substrate-binding protein
MPARLTWRKLVPGLIAAAIIVATTVAVLVFAGVGEMRGEKVRLYVLAAQAQGIMRGSEVWLAGQKIGTIDHIGFARPSADSGGRVVIAIDVLKADIAQLRRDSRVRIRAGANIIGPVVLYFEAGTAASPGLRDGDTLRAVAQSDAQDAARQFAEATKQLPAIMADAKTAMAMARDPSGSLGAARRERGRAGGEFAKLRGTLSHLMGHNAVNGNGSPSAAALAMVGARVALSRADSIRALLASPRTSLGRFRRDATLMGTVGQVRDELAAFRAQLDDADGTVGRLSSDSAMTRSLADTQREMAMLFEDMRKRPLRYVNF